MSTETAAPVVADPNAVDPRSRPVRFVVGVLRQTFVEPVTRRAAAQPGLAVRTAGPGRGGVRDVRPGRPDRGPVRADPAAEHPGLRWTRRGRTTRGRGLAAGVAALLRGGLADHRGTARTVVAEARRAGLRADDRRELDAAERRAERRPGLAGHRGRVPGRPARAGPGPLAAHLRLVGVRRRLGPDRRGHGRRDRRGTRGPAVRVRARRAAAAADGGAARLPGPAGGDRGRRRRGRDHRPGHRGRDPDGHPAGPAPLAVRHPGGRPAAARRPGRPRVARPGPGQPGPDRLPAGGGHRARLRPGRRGRAAPRPAAGDPSGGVGAR